MLLSLFCGAGGLDLGFEEAGYDVGLAFDIRPDSIASYNHNRVAGAKNGHCIDIRDLTLDRLDAFHGGVFTPIGVIGGPPCQSFSRANKNPKENDPRHDLPFIYADIIRQLNERAPLHFFAFENVPGLNEGDHKEHFEKIKSYLEGIGFNVQVRIVNATDFGVPQSRERLLMVGINAHLYPQSLWCGLAKQYFEPAQLTVGYAIGDLPEPTFYRRGISKDAISYHPNHWCMQPKSKKFTTPGALAPGKRANRSFKTLELGKPSITVAYGNREVHIHPNCQRRLSVFEAMRLQGFPDSYELLGSLSSQITQVSEAVPPPMGRALAESISLTLPGMRGRSRLSNAIEHAHCLSPG
ncbi:DNA cytosine methyltransferase [Pseudomonas bharatica]|uniref:DNA cytosine methyltransferase n=1 Tax=Pseudomonas bharatica TaxID=2692112 RepID=UPI003B284074